MDFFSVVSSSVFPAMVLTLQDQKCPLLFRQLFQLSPLLSWYFTLCLSFSPSSVLLSSPGSLLSWWALFWASPPEGFALSSKLPLFLILVELPHLFFPLLSICLNFYKWDRQQQWHFLHEYSVNVNAYYILITMLVVAMVWATMERCVFLFNFWG